MIFISIIVPIYNSYKNIRYKISLYSKIAKLKNVELIFVDDGSKDDCLEFLKKNLSNYKNLRFYRLRKNKGPGIARNYAIKKCLGKYILFLDSDDSIIISNFKKLINFVKTNSPDLIIFNYKNYNNYQINLTKIKINKYNLIKLYLRTELDMNPNFYLFKKKVLIKENIFFEKGFYEDMLFNLKFFYKMKKFKIFKFKIYIKSFTPGSITNSVTAKHLNSFTKASIEKYKYFKKNNNFNFKGKFDLYQDLQYGLRGDFNFIVKMIKKLKISDKSKIKIYIKYKKIISKEYKIKTYYDKVTMKELFS